MGTQSPNNSPGSQQQRITMSPKGLLPVPLLFLILLVCVPNSLGKPTADRDAPETIEQSVTLPETIEESTTLTETENPEEEEDEVGATFTHMRFTIRECPKGKKFDFRKKRCVLKVFGR